MQRNTPVLIITIVLGVLALGATAFMLLGPKSGPAPAQQVAVVPTATPAPRWVANADIPPRTVIDSTMMHKEAKEGPVDPDAITSIDDVQGQLTSSPIAAGQTIRKSALNPSLARAVPANIPIPVGMRGVAIWVDPNQTAAGLVDVGDHIDVIATHKMSWDKGPRQYVIGAMNFTTGRTIGLNLQVLAVDKSINQPKPTPTPVPGAPAAPEAPPAAPTPVPAPTTNARTRVLVAAPPEVAARLVAANDQGVLHITIRNPSDGDAGQVPQVLEYPSRVYTAKLDTPKTAPSTNNNNIPMPTFGPMPTPVPVPTLGPAVDLTPLPTEPPTKEITVIRGTEKTRVVVPQR